MAEQADKAVDVPTEVGNLADKLNAKQSGYNASQKYYDGTSRPKAIGIATPPEMRHLLARNGWGRMYVNALTERMQLEGFRLAGEEQANEELSRWMKANNLASESRMGFVDGLVYGDFYVTVAAPPDESLTPDVPVIKMESPKYFYGELDPRTHLLRKGIRVYTDPETGKQDLATLLMPNSTFHVVKTKKGWEVETEINHQLGQVPAFKVANGARLADRDGHSAITPEMRDKIDAASRLLMNMAATSELMAVPQRLLFGVAKEELQKNPDDPQSAFDAYYARILTFADPEARASQFTAADLRNFVEALNQLAKMIASYTGLPPQYLSFQSDNPASAEAIRSSESRLVKAVEDYQLMSSPSLESAMRMGYRVLGQTVPEAALQMETVWADASTPTYAAKADAVRKLYPDGPIIPLEHARIALGYGPEVRRDMAADDETNPTAQLASLAGIPTLRSMSRNDEPAA